MPRCPRGCCPSAAEHWRSLSIQRPQASERRQRDGALAADLIAYKALRRQRYQPPKIDGSYDLCRRATSEAEIRLGQVISESDAKRRKRGTRLMENMIEIGTNGMTETIPEKDKGSKKLPMKAERPRD